VNQAVSRSARSLGSVVPAGKRGNKRKRRRNEDQGEKGEKEMEGELAEFVGFFAWGFGEKILIAKSVQQQGKKKRKDEEDDDGKKKMGEKLWATLLYSRFMARKGSRQGGGKKTYTNRPRRKWIRVSSCVGY
jgi:hypothetical protein